MKKLATAALTVAVLLVLPDAGYAQRTGRASAATTGTATQRGTGIGSRDATPRSGTARASEPSRPRTQTVRPGRASGSADLREDGAVRGPRDVRGDGFIRGPAVRRTSAGIGSSRDPFFDSRRFTHRPVTRTTVIIHSSRHGFVRPFHHGFAACSIPFTLGRRGNACFQTFFPAAFFVPAFFIFVVPAPQVVSTPYADPFIYNPESDPTCALVTVLLPGNDGYWKSLRLPVDGAVTRDELRRRIGERLRAGSEFSLIDANGVRIDVPAGLQVEGVRVDECRPGPS